MIPRAALFALLLLPLCASAQAAASFNVTDVIVYPQGSGLILQTAVVSGGNFFNTTLPAKAYADSIRVVEAGGMKRIIVEPVGAGSAALSPAPRTPVTSILEENRGSVIELEAASGTYAGRLAWYDERNGMLLLEDVNYTVARGAAMERKHAAYLTMPFSDVRSYVLARRPHVSEATVEPQAAVLYSPYPQPPSRILVSWEDAGSGPRNATMSYLSGGLSWKPQFILDVGADRTRFSYWAQVTNAMGMNLTGVRLRLVAGNINIMQQTQYPRQEWMSATQSVMSDEGYGAVSGSLPQNIKVEEYEVYDFPGRASIESGESAYLPVFDDYVEYRREYVWDARSSADWRGYSSYDSDDKAGKVQRIYTLSNGGRTWPYGVVSVYQDMMLTGQDTISWTPKGGEAKVTVGYAPDIEAKRRETVKAYYKRQSSYDQDYNHMVSLKLRNYKPEAVQVLVMDAYPRDAHNFTATAGYLERPGNIIEWNVTLSPGQSREISYNYFTE